MATSVLAQYLNSRLPASAYTHTVRSGLPQQPNSSDCGVLCQYLNELVSGSYIAAFDISTSHNRRWLAQFVLDEVISQTPSVEIMQPSRLNSTSVLHICAKLALFPFLMYSLTNTSVCASKPNAIIGHTTRQQKGREHPKK